MSSIDLRWDFAPLGDIPHSGYGDDSDFDYAAAEKIAVQPALAAAVILRLVKEVNDLHSRVKDLEFLSEYSDS